MNHNSNIGDVNQNLFDARYYISKVLGYWKLFLATTIIALIFAVFLNGYQQKSYSMETIISVKEENNPLFSTGTNLTFNWGGESNLIETVKISLNSRIHNEKVISRLQFYVDYLQEGRYRLEDVYGQQPFRIKVDTNGYQLKNKLVKVETLEGNQFKLSFNIGEEESNLQMIRYSDLDHIPYTYESKSYSKIFSLHPRNSDKGGYEVSIMESFFSFVFTTEEILTPNKVYIFRFNDLNSTVKKYQKVRVTSITTGASVLRLQIEGDNKARLVDFLNETVKVLTEDKQQQKIKYAIDTKKYIDKLFKYESDSLNRIEATIGDYKKKNKIYNDLSTQGNTIFLESKELSNKMMEVERSIDDLTSLEYYIRSNTNYDSNIPVPAFIEVPDAKVSGLVQELIRKSTLKRMLLESVTAIHPAVIKLENEINLVRQNLYENIASNKRELVKDRLRLKKELDTYNLKLGKLPELEQKLVQLKRNYNFSEFIYTYLKQKSYEAGTAIEASVEDIKVIDSALDLGQKPIYPKPVFNYLVAIMLGIIFPLFFIIVKESLNNKINSIEDIEKRYQIPILGVIGRNLGKNNLVVFERPKSTLAESFRALRSNIQFLFKSTKSKKSKTLVLTSSVSGEGKTIISINMATVFALSGKKTVLLGLDLRKPKMYSNFEINNKQGIVNYLINQTGIEEIINKSHIPNLDIIPSGPIPPNPSELILSDRCDQMITELESIYDYIIIDTPPVGLVSDALELFKYSDAICYVIRQNYSEIGMMKMVEDKYANKEVTNVSYILNDFVVKNKYGYGYNYAYGYGKYGNGYHENTVESESLFSKIIDLFKPKR